jgi:flagellar basal body-associated protein FliL
MIKILLVVIGVLFLVASVLAVMVFAQGKRIKKTEAESRELREAFRQVGEQAGRLQKALGKTAQAEEEADAQNDALAGTGDSDLIVRANSLFM